eukprot:TRINITY_DN4508_c0_g1_i1.p1 TRINITY_DN4508_c0_g1~~TRINITY_DN4508_c0_g1_i1.p1  ORF type:complete len:293 (-),score=28.34 TRINITY_DN4508_c0_g1_i1:216-1013(-)
MPEIIEYASLGVESVAGIIVCTIVIRRFLRQQVRWRRAAAHAMILFYYPSVITELVNAIIWSEDETSKVIRTVTNACALFALYSLCYQIYFHLYDKICPKTTRGSKIIFWFLMFLNLCFSITVTREPEIHNTALFWSGLGMVSALALSAAIGFVVFVVQATLHYQASLYSKKIIDPPALQRRTLHRVFAFLALALIWFGSSVESFFQNYAYPVRDPYYPFSVCLLEITLTGMALLVTKRRETAVLRSINLDSHKLNTEQEPLLKA